jgi:hypothetical protein
MDLRRVVAEVSELLTRYADEQKWDKNDYWIYYHANHEWDLVNFVFVSRPFDSLDERESYQAVWRYLIDHLKDDPGLMARFTLLVRGKEKFDRGGLYGIGPDYHQFLDYYHEFWTVTPTVQGKLSGS